MKCSDNVRNSFRQRTKQFALILVISVAGFEVLTRVIGKDRLEQLSNFILKPEVHQASSESLKYKEWFSKNYDQEAVKEWQKNWLAALDVELSTALRYMPRLEEHRVPLIYKPGRRVFALKSTDGKILHEAVVNVDEDGYRRTIQPDKFDNSVAYLFIGDSFTFGYGLNDEETFCSRFAALKGAYVKNVGILNTGPNDFLYMFRDHSKLKFPEINSKVIKVIYTFNMEYYVRVFMNSEWVNEGVHNYYLNKPYYRAKDGKLEYRGRFNDQHLMVSLYKLYNLTAANTVLQHIAHPEWDDLNSEFALFYKELKDYMISVYPNAKVEFYVSTFPFRNELPSQNFLDELNKAGVDTISFLNTPLDDILPAETLRLPRDSHPSAMSALMYAKMLADKLD